MAENYTEINKQGKYYSFVETKQITRLVLLTTKSEEYKLIEKFYTTCTDLYLYTKFSRRYFGVTELKFGLSNINNIADEFVLNQFRLLIKKLERDDVTAISFYAKATKRVKIEI